MKMHKIRALSDYHDLLRSLQEEAISEIRGTPTKFTQNKKIYWYDTYRVGTDVKKRYLGEDSEALRNRIQNHETFQENRKERERDRSGLVRKLRDGDGFLPIDRGTGGLLAALAKAGAFRLGATVIGTHAFRLYEGTLGLKFRSDETAATDDIDFAAFERLSVNLQDITNPPLSDVLADFEFEAIPDLSRTQNWRWKQAKGNTSIDFLTPSFSEDEGIKKLPSLGVSARSLHYLNYLIANPIPAAVLYRSGVLVQIPQPERFAIHKLIVSDRRSGPLPQLKSRKDRLQAEILIHALAEDRPFDLLEAYQDARGRGTKWRNRIDAALERLPKSKDILNTL